MMGLWLNVGCGTHRAPAPWVNIDVVDQGDTRPDVVVPAGTPLPYEAGTVERVYLGHVLEHVPWPNVAGFLAEIRRVLDGEVLVTGPDVYRTIQRWRAGAEPWWLVESVLEHAVDPETTDWPEAHHHWNCHEVRVVEALERAGFAEVTPVSIFDQRDWPVVNPSAWQLAVRARC